MVTRPIPAQRIHFLTATQNPQDKTHRKKAHSPHHNQTVLTQVTKTAQRVPPPPPLQQVRKCNGGKLNFMFHNYGVFMISGITQNLVPNFLHQSRKSCYGAITRHKTNRREEKKKTRTNNNENELFSIAESVALHLAPRTYRFAECCILLNGEKLSPCVSVWSFETGWKGAFFEVLFGCPGEEWGDHIDRGRQFRFAAQDILCRQAGWLAGVSTANGRVFRAQPTPSGAI